MVRFISATVRRKIVSMIIVLKSLSTGFWPLPKIGGIREFIKYASEHRQLLYGIVVALVLLSLLCSIEQNRKLLFLYSFVIVYLTLLNRKGVGRSLLLTPFWSYRHFFEEGEYFRSMIINNILLFIPLGTILSRLKPRWSMAGTLVMISAGIEILQYLLGCGCCETDDIISNSIGGLIGFTAGLMWMYAARLFQKLNG